MKSNRSIDGEHTLAVFIDFENLALGFHGRRDKFEIGKVLERLVEKGKIVVKKAYSDWSRFGQYTGPLHEAAIELIEIPKRSQTGKNSADIRLVVDAIDLAYSKDHINTFVIVSGDSDFSPLVSKLKELGKHVIGLGLTGATSELLRDNCDEFIYYEDLGRAAAATPTVNEEIPEQKRKVFTLLLDSLLALRRENKEVIYSSMVKDTMKRKKPSFNEGYHGYNTFSELLEDAQRHGIVEIEKHKSSGTYVVVRFGTEHENPVIRKAAIEALPPPPVDNRNRGGRTQTPRQQTSRRTDPPVNGGVVRPPAIVPQPEVVAGNDRPMNNDRPPLNRPQVNDRPLNNDRAQNVDRPPTLDVPLGNERALGRALMDDLHDDGIDDVPSYRPRKAAPVKAPAPTEAAPANKPAEPRRRAPATARPTAAEAPPAQPQPKPATPARRPAHVEPPPAAAPARRQVAAEPAPAQPVAAPVRKRAPAAVVPPKPTPPPADLDLDSGFGAGLGL